MTLLRLCSDSVQVKRGLCSRPETKTEPAREKINIELMSILNPNQKKSWQKELKLDVQGIEPQGGSKSFGI
jgi:hypothetical protein